SPGRVIGSLIAAVFFFFLWRLAWAASDDIPVLAWISWGVIAAVHTGRAWSASVRKRFLNKRFQALWNGCQDRLARFEEVLKKLRREQIAELSEMPKTIRKVADSLYLALRRSDIIAHEVQSSEQGLYSGPAVWTLPSQDPQSKELYRIADKNIAEYKQRLEAVMAGVQRTEAQSAVYMTTLDTLRMKMLGYRLVGKSPELSSHDFLEALSEAKLQLSAIDTALEELELGPYPKLIAAMPPPPIPDDIRQRLNQ
ncbi:MAG TPA: hypothetical protein VMI31_12535, partial [Fimbriimonadaceae bacterium]|nr:hypothetical protein [Fimbriimonadaceae bacterium]